MAGGLFTRLFNRPTGGTISGPNDDSEFDNIISNLLPAKFDDYSATTGQMDSTKDPYPASVQALATSLAEELEHMRWQFELILSTMDSTITEWYEAPPAAGAMVSLTGTQTLTNKTLTAPKIVTGDGIADAGGAFYLKFTEDATPVNYLDVGNADTGVSPNITAAGSDSNIDVLLVSKGTGTIQANGAEVIPQLQTETATTSGTAIDYTSIPSWVKRITVMFDGVSTSGTSYWILQLGDSGGFETTGYDGNIAEIATSTAASADLTDGFRLRVTNTAPTVMYGAITLTLQDATNNVWTCTGMLGRETTSSMIWVAGRKALTAALTQIRLTTTGGSDTFDAGAINVMYE